MKTIRQGDLLFVPAGEVNGLDRAELAKLREVNRKGIIALGEATGHHHRVEALDAAEVFGTGDGAYVQVGPLGVRIVHEEHGPVTLAPSTTYRVHQAREFDYLDRYTPRFVRD